MADSPSHSYLVTLTHSLITHRLTLTESLNDRLIVERLFMVRWVVGSIRHGGPIELFLVPARAPRLV